MEVDKIEEVVIDQMETLHTKDRGIKRNINYDKLIETEQIAIISGIRRSGKSTLLLQLMDSFVGFSYLNFDDERLINFEVSDFQSLLLIFKKYNKEKILFFDEIQNVPQWERFIRRVADEGYKIFFTGSNAKLLGSELATHLSGRYMKIELFPFSFVEILNYNSIDYIKMSTETKANLLKLFDKYMKHGGFPEMVKFEDDEYLKRVYEDIIYKDLIVRYKIRNSKQFKNLSQYLFTNFTGVVSYNSLKSILNIKSTTTIQEYVSYLEESYLIYELYKYDFSLKKQYVSSKKIYVIDNGIRDKIAFKFSSDKGQYLENIVFIELKRRQKDVYFYKTGKNKEIDFLYYDRKTFVAIQVSYSITDITTQRREILPFIEASKELPQIDCLILTYNEEEVIYEDGLKINVVPVWKWLTEQNG